MKTILIIDDDRDVRLLLASLFKKNGFQCLEAKDSNGAIQALNENSVDVVLCDFKLRKESAVDVIAVIKKINVAIPVIIMTGYTNIRAAVEVMKLGAIDYCIKPLLPAEILAVVNKALNFPVEKIIPVKKVESKSNVAYVLSPNIFFQTVLKQIDLVAPTDYTVILYGESGSGKEAFAQEIHKRSKRKKEQFLAVDCGALSKELAGSILFGHEKGAFTGAMNQNIGAFEIISGGTLFLDEISNLSYEIQVSLLRVMQERTIRRIGGNEDIKIDVRVIVASNKKLWDETKVGSFREDLYHRFNEFAIDILPLRNRKDDILFYADHFLAATNKELGKAVLGFSDNATHALLQYEWPGNLRELNNIVKRAVLMTSSDYIDTEIFAQQFLGANHEVAAAVDVEIAEIRTIDQAELDYKKIIGALRQTAFNKKRAALLLGIDIKVFNRQMKAYADMKGFVIDF